MKSSDKLNTKLKNIFLLSIISAVVFGVILFIWGIKLMPEEIRIWIAYLPFFVFTFGILGWIINYEGKSKHGYSWMIYFPLILAFIYYLLLFIHVFVLEPILCPCLKPTM